MRTFRQLILDLMQKEPFDDVRVRQAINYALDMNAVVETVYAGVGAPATGPLDLTYLVQTLILKNMLWM